MSFSLEDLYKGLTGQKGLETAAAGARDAQKQANALADLQWQRQMMGLQEARGQTQPYLSLYDKIYGTRMAGNVTPVAGLQPPPGSGGPGGPAGAGTPPPGSGRIAPDPNRGVGAAVYQIGGGRGPGPGGYTFPQSQRGFGEALYNAGGSTPAYAPPTTGRPPGAPPPVSGAGGGAQVNFNQPLTPAQPNGMNNGIAQLLAALGYR